jgi:hypothetical protein
MTEGKKMPLSLGAVRREVSGGGLQGASSFVLPIPIDMGNRKKIVKNR